MIQANVHEAKTQLSKLIERALAGEEVVIARHGAPAVRLQPVVSRDTKPPSGLFGWLGKEPALPEADAWRRMDEEIAREMSDTSKFDVELGDTLEYIPPRR